MHDLTDKIMVFTLIAIATPLLSYVVYLVVTGKGMIDDGDDMEGDSIFAL